MSETKTICGCEGCESWGAIRDAWVAAANAAPSADQEPPEPVVLCKKTGQKVAAWGPALRASRTSWACPSCDTDGVKRGDRSTDYGRPLGRRVTVACESCGLTAFGCDAGSADARAAEILEFSRKS